MRVLIIKMSSMGDVIHTLPALTDAAKHLPDIQFDWLVESGFAEIPTWHPHVAKVISINLRAWRKAPLKEWPTLKAALSEVVHTKYDLVIDAQGLIKSALITFITSGTKHGLDKASSKERGLRFAYDHAHTIPKEKHAVERVRMLFAKALGYPTPTTPPDYGIRTAFRAKPLKKRYLVFLVNTTWATKLYPNTYWTKLIEHAKEAGFSIKITSGNPSELKRAQALAAPHKGVEALDRLSIQDVAKLLSRAAGVIAVDTGFAHLAAALHIPCVGLYGPTNPDLSANYGPNQVQLRADFPCAPCLLKQCTHKDRKGEITPPCFTTVPPDAAWAALMKMVK